MLILGGRVYSETHTDPHVRKRLFSHDYLRTIWVNFGIAPLKRNTRNHYNNSKNNVLRSII